MGATIKKLIADLVTLLILAAISFFIDIFKA
jgi:hypothetical protein